MTTRLVRAGAAALFFVLTVPGPARAETLTGGIQVITLIRPACRIAAGGRIRDDLPRTPAGDAEFAMTCTRGVFPSVTMEGERVGGGGTPVRASGVSRSNLLAVDGRLVHRPRAPAGGRIGTVIATVHF